MVTDNAPGEDMNSDDDDSFDDDSNTPLVLELDEPLERNHPSTSSTKPPRRNKPVRLFWEQTLGDEEIHGHTFCFESTDSTEEGDVRLPIWYFRSFMDDRMIKLIVDQSNLYSIQKNPNKPLALNQNELEQWLGLSLVFC